MRGNGKNTDDKSKVVYIATFGCQMNIYDSELMVGILYEQGFLQVFEPVDAGIIIMNTCSVRKHAEDRAFSNLGKLYQQVPKNAKKPIFCLTGCTAKKLGEEIINKYPYIDIVVSPANIYNLLKFINSFLKTGKKQIHISDNTSYINKNFSVIHSNKVKALVTIMQGCDNYCAYCVVPYVRGKEISRPIKNILKEIEELAAQGFKEVTLLGQNVNSYRDGQTDFAGLLRLTSQIPGIERIRFMTNHPKDLSVKLINAIAKTDKICKHIHLPLQSGADRILQKMNRGYTAQKFLSIVGQLRKHIPAITITTDIIVGFPGESESDFKKTLSLLKKVKFDASFIFKYSPREGTAAAQLKDDVSATIKQERLVALNEAQQKIAQSLSRKLINKTFAVLIEDYATDPRYLFGKTESYRTVLVTAPAECIGQLIAVKILSAKNWTLYGAPDF